jgi:para-nitrobenzyl esterase
MIDNRISAKHPLRHFSLVAAAAVAIALLSPVARASAGEASPPTAQTRSGVVQGVYEDGIRAYKGVPFAAPPIGDLRWRDPQPVTPWVGVRSARSFAPICPQTGDSLPGATVEPKSEDCLYLNIWTPATAAKKKLPVMVWIYGGGWTNGSASIPNYWGDKLARRGVIVVTIAYRIGALGFFSLPELSAESPHHTSGNYGLLDQIAALRWVQANIGAFGGDAGRVTIRGQSAGSMSASILMSSPLAKGLFQRAIGESGGTFEPAQISSAGAGFFLHGAESDGLKSEASLGVKTVAEMRAMPADKVNGAIENTHWIVDGYVLPEPPYATFKAGRQNDVPLLVGTNADEGLPLMGGVTTSAATFDADLAKAFGPLPPVLTAAYEPKTDAGAFAARANLERDLRFGWDMRTWARLQSTTGTQPVFVYYFTRVPPYPAGSPYAHWGAGHWAEMRYAFDNLEVEPWSWTAQDRRLADDMAAYWTNFAKAGDPNGDALPAWLPYQIGNERALELGDNVKMITYPNLAALQVLDALFAPFLK